MSKFVRRETVRKCAIHQTIMERASEDLEHSGAFNKEEILETLGLIVMADSVRWDYIREFLQEDQGCELVPVAASYFKRHKRDEELTSPERFIASVGSDSVRRWRMVQGRNSENMPKLLWNAARF